LYVDKRLRGLLWLVTAFLRRFHAGAERTFVSTGTLKDELERLGFRNVVVVPFGVDTEFFVRSERKDLPTLPAPVFVYVGRLAPEKSPEEFLALDLPGTKLVIGDGPDRKKLEHAYTQSSVIFVGYRRGQELVDWLSKGDVLVFPSRTETFGLVALEALSCGIPVAAHAVMGPGDIVSEGITGYLDEDLKKAALQCLSLNSEDCRASALTYSWERSTDLFIDSLAMIAREAA
jgi:glycosyltransferase involved in cell wall biosynthesis